MKRLALLFALASIQASAATDYNCVNDCTAQGYMYQGCVARCSYSTSVPMQNYQQNTLPPPKQTDYKCVSDCTTAGYQYMYCQQRCTY